MRNIVNTYAALSVAIVLEVAGTTFLQLSEQLTRLVPTSVMACVTSPASIFSRWP
jgi:small multidrug resistance pump